MGWSKHAAGQSLLSGMARKYLLTKDEDGLKGKEHRD
jgi:hypothetical protein